jgi:hypothetical protein
MRVEPLPGMTNVVRFPVERRARPTLALLRDIAPDVREVMNLAEVFGMEAPVPDLRERTDAATAEYILNQVPTSGPRRGAALNDLEVPVIERAVAACRAAHDASVEAAEAEQVLLRAQTAGRFWVEALRERAERLTERGARLLLEAHAWAEEAEGVARAVGLARRGEVWTSRDGAAEMDALIAAHRAAAG